ncbi:MAG: ATP-dependent helicase [Butyrivibrio sp.]|nr:ATP-dependent helicase [Butyrivibrio sp.]
MRNENLSGNDICGNKSQQMAITHINGPAMVLAGPGSGKTFVIVQRIRYLIEKVGIEPSSILVITFTKAAAIEMQYRFMKLTDSSYPEVSFGTFHSVFYQIIRSSRSCTDSNIEIATLKFKTEIIRDILLGLYDRGKIKKDDYEKSLDMIPDILSEISRIKNTLDEPENNLCDAGIRPHFGEILSSYNRRLAEFGKIDFDDMLTRCYELLLRDKELLQIWQNRYKYFLIDEYQDINKMQYKVVRILSGHTDNLFAVGDDDQSIYGFRGSDPGIMLAFKDSFPKHPAKLINLNINYRCGSTILLNALKVIEQNTVRFDKELTAEVSNGPGVVAARRYESRQKQNEAIAQFLGKHKNALDDIAILFRTNSEALSLARVLNEYDIPTSIDDHRIDIFADKAVKLCISYLSFAYCGHRRGDFLKIMNMPMRYISRDAVSAEVVTEREIERFYSGNGIRQRCVKKLFGQLKMIEHLRPGLAIRYIRKTVGVDMLFGGSRESLDEFERICSGFESTSVLLKYCSERSAVEENKKQKAVKRNESCVKILTMHASKGLEFKTVWLPDLNEGIIPSRSATTKLQTEEERRMLYVAMTRAKQALIMSYVTGTKENPMLPSRFLRPIRDNWEKNYQ